MDLLTFTGVKTGWTVLDMGAGAGYSTELMARSVGPAGKVYAQIDEEFEKLRARLTKPVMNNVTVLVRPSDDPVPSDLHDLDLITFYLRLSRYDLHGDRSRENEQGDVRGAEARRDSSSSQTIRLDPKTVLQLARPITALPSRHCARRLRRRASSSSPTPISCGMLRTRAPSIVFRNPTPVDEFVLKFQKPM